ncbi:MAG: NAD-dependent epimerase/dehydratase family protein [Dongiaceae bacterium]
MTVLVTGAAGFVGSAVARALLAKGAAVRTFVRPTSDRGNLNHLAVERVFGDLRDRKSIERAVKGCEAVFHVAADYRLWVPQPREMFANNVDGTRHVMEAAAEAGIRRIVYTSSVCTLGLPGAGESADEDTPATQADMIGPYKQSKFAAEALVRAMIAERGLPAVIVHPSTPIGPWDRRPTPTGQIIVEAASGHMPAYVDTGLNLVHVDDVAEGHILALEHGRPGERFILGGDNLTLKEILTEIAVITGRPAPRIQVPHRVVMPIAAMAEMWGRISNREPFVTLDGVRLARKKMFFSSQRAIERLGYRPRPATEAIVDAIDWFERHGYLR